MPGVELAERATAEAWAAGADGLEERAGGEGVVLIVYVASQHVGAVLRALSPLEAEGMRVGPSEVLEAEDWREGWKAGLRAIVISPRLVVRPSFVGHVLGAGQRELVIDPGQAFGTGGHASTELALQWIDELTNESACPARVLDVGTGTGVLAMAAVLLGADSAVAFDLDREAAREAANWAARNRLADRLRLFAGPLEALRAPAFDLVLVNLLRREMLPMAPGIADAVASGGCAILSGLLASDREVVVDAFSRLGLLPSQQRSLRDEGGDDWISLAMKRSAPE